MYRPRPGPYPVLDPGKVPVSPAIGLRVDGGAHRCGWTVLGIDWAPVGCRHESPRQALDHAAELEAERAMITPDRGDMLGDETQPDPPPPAAPRTGVTTRGGRSGRKVRSLVPDLRGGVSSPDWEDLP